MSDRKIKPGGNLFIQDDQSMSGRFMFNDIDYNLESTGEVFKSDKEGSAGRPFEKIVFTNPSDENDIMSGLIFRRDTDKEDGKIGIGIIFRKNGDQQQYETSGIYTMTKPKDYQNPTGERVSVKPYYRLLAAQKEGEWKKKKEEAQNPF